MKGAVGRLQLKLSDDATDVDDQHVNIVMIGTAWALIIEHCGMVVSGQYDKQGKEGSLGKPGNGSHCQAFTANHIIMKRKPVGADNGLPIMLFLYIHSSVLEIEVKCGKQKVWFFRLKPVSPSGAIRSGSLALAPGTRCS